MLFSVEKTGRNLQCILLSKISQSENPTYYYSNNNDILFKSMVARAWMERGRDEYWVSEGFLA